MVVTLSLVLTIILISTALLFSLAFATNAIIILHVCWGVLFFDGFDQIKISGWPHLYIGLIKVFVVVASHMLISALVS